MHFYPQLEGGKMKKLTPKDIAYNCFPGIVSTNYSSQTWQALARASRRFVRMENEQKRVDNLVENVRKAWSPDKLWGKRLENKQKGKGR